MPDRRSRWESSDPLGRQRDEESEATLRELSDLRVERMDLLKTLHQCAMWIGETRQMVSRLMALVRTVESLEDRVDALRVHCAAELATETSGSEIAAVRTPRSPAPPSGTDSTSSRTGDASGLRSSLSLALRDPRNWALGVLCVIVLAERADAVSRLLRALWPGGW